MTKVLSLLFLIICSSAIAQSDENTNNSENGKKGDIIIYGDEQVSALLKKHVSINKKKCPHLVKGYRVQIYSSAGNGSREKANHDQVRFLSNYPDINAYSIWEQPNWKVRVGDCRTRFEAEKLKKEIQVNFPNCFVVVDYIDTVYLEDCK
ncbi:MAG: SPOR domain-containing protein [Bacteroidetes bacterium]|nr:SPOR domain-containing protein [Bacteroidota bacterium]